MGDRGGEVLGRMRNFFRGSPGESPKSMSSPSSAPPVGSSNGSGGPARPIRLVYTDEKGRFHMDPEAVAVLQLVKEPVGVVSVCGRARQGKSFILNQLLGRSSGFKVAPTHRPCTKGLWLWSSPIRRTALDGTEYNLLLLDSEGIDAYDQTGTYSTQIFSLAVLLSSMFIYNQMGGIDEAALDRLSLVTEMTKHIRVRASGGRTTASELGQFSPIFVWLLRDFYLDLEEDNRKIMPRDYLELALRPVQGGGKDVAAKNEIRDSIRALFPDRECYTLVRPLSNENELHRLDQIPLEKLRSEFRSGLDALTKFIFERARPKQMGATTMTGPILARITQSFLDALNNGAVPTITSSWQSVEEAECQRAYELGSEAYVSAFDRSKPPEEAALREAHEDAVQKSMTIFNDTAVGSGSTRQKYEKRLLSFFRKAFEDIKKDLYAEAHMKCTNTIESMGRDLRLACHAPDAKIDTVVTVLDELLLKYDTTCRGPEKWHKAFLFLQQSLEGPILDLIKRQINQMGTEKNSIALKCHLAEDKMALLNKQLEASEKYKLEYMKRFEDATNEKKKLADDYTSRIANMQNKYGPLEEKCSNLSKDLDRAKQESLEWKRKCELGFSKHKAAEEQSNAEVAMLRSKASAAEARLAASQEKAKSALEDVEEWKRKYEFAVREVKTALENANSIQERLSYQTQSKEAALRAEFAGSLAEKDEEIAEKSARLEQVEQRLTTLSLEMKAAESKIKSYDLETSNLKSDIKNLVEKVESSNAAAVSAENKVRIIEQEKGHLEQTYQGQFDRFAELQERCKFAEKEAKRATELADEARAEASSAQKEKSNLQRVAMERLAQIERAERQAETLERQKVDLMNEIERHQASEEDALYKVQMLEERLRGKEQELDSLLQSNSSQRKHTVEILEKLLESERTAHANSNKRAEELSLQLQATQGQVDELSHELNTLRYGDKMTSDGRARSISHAKRGRISEHEIGMDSVHDNDIDARPPRANKRSKSNTVLTEGVSVSRIDEHFGDSHLHNLEDYTKLTKDQLKEVLAKNGVGEVWKKNVAKNELLALIEKYIVRK